MTPEIAVRATIIVATLAWAAGEVLMRRSPDADRRARAAWTVGIALAAVHVALAFHFVYDWDHAVAVAETARQTEAQVGWGWRGGIYVNYLFLSLWLADVCWWWAAPASHAARSRGLELARFAIFLFMFVNGAIVFASGIARIAGICAVAAALGSSPAGRMPLVSRIRDRCQNRGARRPAGKARRPRILGIFKGGATPPDGMPRPRVW